MNIESIKRLSDLELDELIINSERVFMERHGIKTNIQFLIYKAENKLEKLSKLLEK